MLQVINDRLISKILILASMTLIATNASRQRDKREGNSAHPSSVWTNPNNNIDFQKIEDAKTSSNGIEIDSIDVKLEIDTISKSGQPFDCLYWFYMGK